MDCNFFDLIADVRQSHEYVGAVPKGPSCVLGIDPWGCYRLRNRSGSSLRYYLIRRKRLSASSATLNLHRTIQATLAPKWGGPNKLSKVWSGIRPRSPYLSRACSTRLLGLTFRPQRPWFRSRCRRRVQTGSAFASHCGWPGYRSSRSPDYSGELPQPIVIHW